MERKLLWMWLKDIFVYSDLVPLKLVEIFGSIEAVHSVTKKQLGYANIKGLDNEKITRLCDKSMDKINKLYDYTTRLGAKVICIDDEEYPQKLRHIHEPPPVLYVLGDIGCIKNKLVIAGVGTRQCSAYGTNMAKIIAANLAEAGVVVVSGMASGIDSAVHTGAFAQEGVTVAVLGTAIDKIYPAENKDMYYRIIKCGAVISEHPPGYKGFRFDFQRRNRIIAGISDGVFICQAPKRSGSMITAKMALDMGRDLFCVAGNAEPVNEGSNSLIMEGAAKMILSAKDILDEYEIYKDVYDIKEPAPMPEAPHGQNKKRYFVKLTPEQELLCDLIGDQKIHLDALCELTKLDFPSIAAAVTQLELLDMVDNENGIISLR